jgi:hypothetical protein
MSKVIVLILLTLILHSALSGQEKGIFDRQIGINSFDKNKPVSFAYVIISSPDRNLIFVSDEYGKCKIQFDNCTASDSALVTCIGYKNSKVLLSSIKDVIFLEPTDYKLNEIVVKPAKSRLIKLGNLANIAISSYQIGFKGQKVIYIPNSGITGKIISIRYYMHDFLEKEFKYRPFRVRVYEPQKNSDSVGTDLLKKELIAMLPRKEGNWIEVNISQWNILFPSNGIFVGLEVMPAEYYLRNGYIKTETILMDHHHNRTNSLSIGCTLKNRSKLDIQTWDYFNHTTGWTQKYSKDFFPLIQIIVETNKKY